ncbi:MAG: hypothetical protein H5T69_20920 [Chloroflexi bacterium]|nr:hypothetical protein [Chloroflexota bacterium]
MQLRGSNLDALERAKEAGYLIIARKKHSWPLYNAWWRWCEEHQWPFVYIRPRRAYASVHLDMEPTGVRLSEMAMGRVAELVYMYNEWRHGGFATYGNHTSIPNVRMERAEEAARALLGLALQEVYYGQSEATEHVGGETWAN